MMKIEMLQDQILFIQQINQKKIKAYRLLFKRFYKPLVHFSFSYTKDSEQAEDIVQDIFLKLWEGNTKITSYNEFRTMLYTSVRNASLNWLKHKKVEDKYLAYAIDNHKENENDIDFKIMKEELYQILIHYVEQLPDRRKQIFKLYMQGKKTDEIALLLGISVETVRGARKESIRFLRNKTKDLFIWFIILKII